MDKLISSAMQQAPQVLHHIFSLEGANEVLTGLETVESKAAYLIQIIAVELYKASKSIDATKLSSGPNDIKFHITRSNTFFKSFPFTITIHDLGDFEDVYYAACAKLKELLHGVDLLLTNAFKNPHESYFTYASHSLSSLGAINISDFRASLLVHEAILYSKELKDLLNRGIVKKSIRDNKSNYQQRTTDGDSLTQQDSSNTYAAHQDLLVHTNQHANIRQGTFQKKLGWLAGVQGLQDMSNMSCGMIFGGLAEKYRPIVASEGSEGASIIRTVTPEAPQAWQEEVIKQSYISPYNLNERAKKLNAPGGPEMPCLCDPDCMCAPLCASDPTQNCLCEENGLFARVTEGMDIDDLDVPDLVRRKTQASLNSKISASSFTSNAEASAPGSVYGSCPTASIAPGEGLHGTSKDIEQQKDQQVDQAWNNVDFSDNIPMQIDNMAGMNIVLSTPPNPVEDEFWQVPSLNPLRTSSLSYREALRQPFSVQCAHPPKRSSVAARLLSSRINKSTASKRHSISSHVSASADASNTPNKVIKQGGKRSLADMSFAGLRLALRRDSQVRGGSMRE
ncbi:hypothetical protein P7C71_g2517, partial [Lecanoromycetidae sp. Uapishka_2]